MAAILIDLRAPRDAAGNEDLLPVMPFLSTGTTPLLFSSVRPRASHRLPALAPSPDDGALAWVWAVDVEVPAR
jgi:hypothetical protein